MEQVKTTKIELVYPDLSYKVIGVLFEVYNELGPDYKEKYYQKAIATLKINNLKLGILAYFTNNGVRFKRILNISK